MFGLFLHFLAAYTQVVFFIKSWETFSKTSRKFFSLKIQLYSIILSILTVSIFVLFGNNQIIKIKDKTKINYDLEKIANETTLRGMFAKQILEKMNMENITEEEKEILEKTVEIAFEALE